MKIVATIVILFGLSASVWFFHTRKAQAAFDRSENVLPAEAVNVITNADRFVLFSLDPIPKSLHEHQGRDIEQTFHDYPVLGRVTITNKDERTELLNAFFKGIRDSDGSIALCFNPRHGISAVRREEVIDLVICFECRQTQVYFNGSNAKRLSTTRSPQAAFDRSLEKAGIPKESRREPTPDPGFE
jgi:hypothetical protein